MSVFPKSSALPRIARFLLAACLASGLAACRAAGPATPTPSPIGDVYRPPTAPPATPTLRLANPTADLRPSSTPECSDVLAYQEDLSVPDGSTIQPGVPVDKRWRLENSGSCNWDARYRLRLIAGPSLGVPSEQALYPARSGTQFTLQIIFTAPNEPGTYRSAWQAYDPHGQAFGDPFFVEIQVPAASP
jgi:Ig-like domain from next to BRCA1 gene